MIANRPVITTAAIADAQSGAETIHHGQEIIPKSFRMAATADKRIRGGSGVIPWQSYPKMIDKRYMKNGRSDTPCS